MSHYHQQSAYQRGDLSGHGLDWSRQPHPFKRYSNREPRPMARPRWPAAGFFDLARGNAPRPPASVLDEATVSSLLLMSAGITALAKSADQAMGLRAPASAGALYPAELYLVAEEVADLEPGVYHFSPDQPGLHPLWPGRLARRAGQALGREPSRLSFFITAMYWRSVWKYRGRAYRYCLLDSGHMLANLELALAAHGLASATVYNFVDSAASALLGLAPRDEAALVGLAAGGAVENPEPDAGGLPPLDLAAQPLSSRVGVDQQVLEAHRAGILTRAEPNPAIPPARRPENGVALPAPTGGPADLLEVVRRRRSRRNFIPATLGLEDCSNLLAAALPGPSRLGVTVALKTPDLPAGPYRYLPGHHLLSAQPAGGGDPAHQVAAACLNQMWVGQAALLLLLSAPVAHTAEVSGPRSYRHLMLDAGAAGQRLYLAATALGLGCCGVGAFYDAELAAAMGLPPGEVPLYLLACGPVKGGIGL